MVPRGDVPWGLLDMVVILIFWQFSMATAIAFAQGSPPPATDAVSVASRSVPLDAKSAPEKRVTSADCIAMTLASIAAWVCGSVWLFRRGAIRQDLGHTKHSFLGDVVLGFQAYCLLAPPVLFVQSLLANFWPTTPHHPLVRSLVEHGNSGLYWSIVLAAVVGAPLVEEFVFRVVLQGWLERVAADWRYGVSSLRLSFHEILVGGPAANRTHFSHQRPFWWPIGVSSLFFAAAHLGQGPAPISLFLLALGLGYVYERTHRWLPCAVTHMLINGVTMIQLWFIIDG